MNHLGPTGGMGREGEKGRGRRERKRELRERSSTFSLSFPAIGPTVSGGARGKAHPRDKSFKLRPGTGSFDKLQEVGVFLLLGLIFV